MTEINGFYSELRTCTDAELVDFCRQKLLHGLPHVFLGNEANYYRFRKTIADHFRIHFHEVLIIGSAKLGFSPQKKSPFDYDSDIDVAIISPRLYEDLFDRLLAFQLELRANRRTISDSELRKYHSFLEYTAMGWMRPDKLPVSFKMGKIRNDWFDFFASISYGKSDVGNYKVSGGAWKSYRHIEHYTVEMIARVRSTEQVKVARGHPN